MGGPTGRAQHAARLRPYVASLVLTWLRDSPQATWREVDGTLVFVDISGFTKLTERLAERGKGGAEEMSDILDATFGELLWVAYSYGAQLVKWGGDAVLLLFTGDGHAPRACRAAYDMRATMRRIGHLRTSAGAVTLRMSVGIHSGTFHFFLVGTLHRELLVTGPGATTTARIEGVAEAGEIGLSPQTAALLAPNLVGVEKTPGVWLLRGRPRVPETPRRTTLDLAGIDVASCLTAPTREHLLAGGTDGEHRQIAVAFVEFKETDALLAAQGPGALAAALHEVVSVTQDACARHGVTFWETDISPDGGKIMLVGGAPRSTDDDAGAMLATARDVADGVRTLPLRIGVNHGRVFSGDFGPDYRRTYSVKGDAVNLAARVMGKAAPGEVWATEGVLEHSRLSFDAERLEPFLVKGKARPVQAYRLGRVMQGRVGTPDDDLPLISRERELAVLHDATAAAAAGRGCLVELVGEPGIGKSRLLAELACRSPDLRTVDVGCDAYHSSTPYAPFRTLLRELLDIPYDAEPGTAGELLATRLHDTAPDLLQWLPLVAVVVDADVAPTAATSALDEKFRKGRLEQVTTELLHRLLPSATLVVVEDAHLADDASADLLAHVAESIASRPWAMVVSRRTSPGGFAPQAPSARIDLLPLDDFAAQTMLAIAAEESPLPPHEFAALAQRAEGNPLFLLQLLDAVRRTGSVNELPDSIEGVITARIDRLPPRERRLLRTAAVLGVRFEPRVLDAVLDADGDRLEAERLADFLQLGDDGMVAFRHALVRDTAYEGLPFTRRRELHGRAGDVLERLYGERTDERADLLSLHFLQAGRFERAWRYARVAGQRADGAYAYVESAVFYERALAAARRSADADTAAIADVTERLGDARSRLGEFARADAAYADAARALRSQPLDRARIFYKQADICVREGAHSPALRRLSRGLTVLSDQPGIEARRLRARLSSFYGLVRHNQGRDRDAARWGRRAVVEAETSRSPATLAEALLHLDVCLTFADDGGGKNARRALGLWRRLGDSWQEARTLNQLGIRAYFGGRWPEALAHYRDAAAAFDRAGDQWMASVVRGNLAETLSDQGHVEEAIGILELTLPAWRASSAPTMVGFGLSLLARAHVRAGRFEEAAPLYAEARALFTEHGEPVEVLETDARRVESSVLQGRGVAVLGDVAELLERCHRLPGGEGLAATAHRLHGLALAQLGDLLEARAALQRSIASAQQRGATHEIVWALDALDQLAGASQQLPIPSQSTELRSLMDGLGMVQIARPGPTGHAIDVTRDATIAR